MTYYVQPVDDTQDWGSYGLSDTSGSGYRFSADTSNDYNYVSDSGPVMNYSGGEQEFGDFWGDTAGSSDAEYGDWGGEQMPYGGDYSDFGGGYNPWDSQTNPNYGYEYGSYEDSGMNPNYGYEYGYYDDYSTNPNYGYEYGGYTDDGGYSQYGLPSGGGESPGTRWTPTDYGQYDETRYGSNGGSSYGSGGGGGGSSGNVSSKSRTQSKGPAPKPPQPRESPRPGSATNPLVSSSHIPLPDVTAAPQAADLNVLPQYRAAWDRLQNFLDNPMEALRNDPQYLAQLAEGNRNLAAKHRGKRTRFSGESGVDFEKYGVEAAAQNLDRIAGRYGESAAQELQRWIPAANLDFNRQTTNYQNDMDAWKAQNQANFLRYGASQGDVRNLIAANQVNQGNFNNYAANAGAADMLNWYAQLQDYYGE